VFILVLAAVFLREPLTRRKLLAVTLGIAGAVVAVN
jgi:drug/metabolite transporter (DMT)-like permease